MKEEYDRTSSAILCDRETARDYLTQIANSPAEDIDCLFNGEADFDTITETARELLDDLSGPLDLETTISVLDRVSSFFSENLDFNDAFSDYHTFIGDYESDRDAFFEEMNEELI